MSAVLYYSNYCGHCKELLYKLSRSQIKKDVHFICIDKRTKQSDGSIHLTLENGETLLLPPNVKTVPSILLLHHGNRILDGLKDIENYFSPQEKTINKVATKSNGEPLAFSMSEMGAFHSDNYSYLDMTSEELSAKGSGGLRQMHSYTTLAGNQSIATPPDDYIPNKIGSVDLSKLQQKRNEDITNKK